MPQRNTLYIQRLRSCLRLLTPVLYFCLIVSVTWYESSFSTSTRTTATLTAVAGHHDVDNGFELSQENASRRLPSLLAPVAKLPLSARQRPENQNNNLSPLQPCWAVVVSDTPRLFSLRIDPVAWESRPPSFLLPSAYGLVPFAIPPPFCLV